MELELGIKITRTRDDLTSQIRIAKDRAGPLFVSRETETKFVLTAHLKGFKREGIKIVINENGTQIAIRGEKPIQEMVMVKWIMYKKEGEIREFRKVFFIPDDVILDRIKAKFNEEDTILNIFIPKKTRGIRGIEIEEVKQEQFEEETEVMTREDDDRIGETSSDSLSSEEITEVATAAEEPEQEQDRGPEIEKAMETPETTDRDQPVAEEIEDHKSDETDKEEESPKVEMKKSVCDRSTQTEKWSSSRKLCCPGLFAGSAFLISLIVLVVQLLRNQKKR